MKDFPHYVGLALLIAPIVILLYRSYKAGMLRPVLKGAGCALAVAAWSATVAYLLSH